MGRLVQRHGEETGSAQTVASRMPRRCRPQAMGGPAQQQLQPAAGRPDRPRRRRGRAARLGELRAPRPGEIGGRASAMAAISSARRCNGGRGRSPRRGPRRPGLDRAGERLHGQIVGDQNPRNPMKPRMTSAMTRDDMVAGRSASMRGDRTNGRSCPAACRPAPETDGSRWPPAPPAPPRPPGGSRWLSTGLRPWPGRCLITGVTPAARKPSQAARPEPPRSRDRREGAVADDLMGAGKPEIADRRRRPYRCRAAPARRRSAGR